MVKKLKAEKYGNVTLEFDEENHRLLVNGIRNPYNVTGITGVIDKSGPLVYWAVGLAKNHLLSRLSAGEAITEADVREACGKHQERKEEGANIGSIVHDFAEMFSLGLKPDLPEEEQARNGALAYLKWLDSEKIKVSNPEEILFSKKHGYWGVKDSDGKRGKESFVIDYKTSKSVYPEMHLQVSAYMFAAEEMHGRKYDGAWIVKFGKDDGNFEPVFIPRKESVKDFKAFLAAFTLKKRLLELNAKG